MSVAVEGLGIFDLREVIRPLGALDVARGAAVVLQTGTVLDGCHIHRNAQVDIDAGAEPYTMEFESGGRRYACPLVSFQPRTQAAVASVSAEVGAAPDALAV